jgi:tRNA A-37 threonylcarbamoyl transferase component Bud32
MPSPSKINNDAERTNVFDSTSTNNNKNVAKKTSSPQTLFDVQQQQQQSKNKNDNDKKRTSSLSDLQRLRLSSIEKLNEMFTKNGANFDSIDSPDAYSSGSDEFDEANSERKLKLRKRMEEEERRKELELKEKLESLYSETSETDRVKIDEMIRDDATTSTEGSNEDSFLQKMKELGIEEGRRSDNNHNNGMNWAATLNTNTNNNNNNNSELSGTTTPSSLLEVPTRMPKFMIWLPTVASKEGTLEKRVETRGNWFTNLLKFNSPNADWKLRHFVLYDNHLFWGKGFSRMYGYGTVLAARDAFEYGETAIAVDLLLYPKKSSRHGGSSSTTPQSLIEALTGTCCKPEGFSAKIVRCETLSEKISWLIALNKKDQSKKNKNQQQGITTNADEQNNTKNYSNVNDIGRTGSYTIQPPSPRISHDGVPTIHVRSTKNESKTLSSSARDNKDFFKEQQSQTPTIGSPLFETTDEDETDESEEEETDESEDDDGFRTHSVTVDNVSALDETKTSRTSTDDSVITLDPSKGISHSGNDSDRAGSSRSDVRLARTGSGSVRFRNRSLSPAPNQRSPGSTPRTSRAAHKHINGQFSSVSSIDGGGHRSKASAHSDTKPPKPPFDPNAKPKQSSMKRSAIHSAFTAAQQQAIDEADKIASATMDGDFSYVINTPPSSRGSAMFTSPPGSKKSVTFRNDASLEEVKKYDATPKNGKKKKKTNMFQNNVSASAWAEQLERRSSRALIKAAGSWTISINDLIFGRKIGTGSFGKVYKAKWHGTNVAVKKTHDVSTHVTVKEFAAEIRLMRDLRHPNIVLFLGAVVDAPSMCIVTELMKRGNLHSILHDVDNIVRETVAENGRLRLQMATDCARGMSYLHSRSPPIVHHDLKPANLLVDSKWNLKISDFGMSRIKYRAYLQKSNPELETAGGTPEWMSPEALRNDNVDELSDVYSFGIILWELITLNYPWQELNDPVQIVGKVAFLHHRPNIPSWVETEIEQLLLDCWARDSGDRPEFRQILELLQSAHTPGAWSLGKGVNAREVKRSKYSQFLKDEQLEAALNTQDIPQEPPTYFGFGSSGNRSSNGSVQSISSSQYTYDNSEDPYIPRGRLSMDEESLLSSSAKSKSTGGLPPTHQRRESHENILAFRPQSLTGLTIKTPTPIPDGKEHDRPSDVIKVLPGLQLKIGKKTTEDSESVTNDDGKKKTEEAENKKLSSLKIGKPSGNSPPTEDDEYDEDEDDSDEISEDLESEVSGFSQLSEAQQQKMNSYLTKSSVSKKSSQKSRLTKTSPTTQSVPREPKTPRMSMDSTVEDSSAQNSFKTRENTSGKATTTTTKRPKTPKTQQQQKLDSIESQL